MHVFAGDMKQPPHIFQHGQKKKGTVQRIVEKVVPYLIILTRRVIYGKFLWSFFSSNSL